MTSNIIIHTDNLATVSRPKGAITSHQFETIQNNLKVLYSYISDYLQFFRKLFVSLRLVFENSELKPKT